MHFQAPSKKGIYPKRIFYQVSWVQILSLLCSPHSKRKIILYPLKVYSLYLNNS